MLSRRRAYAEPALISGGIAMQSNPVPTHTLTLTGRSTATLTGVEDVD